MSRTAVRVVVHLCRAHTPGVSPPVTGARLIMWFVTVWVGHRLAGGVPLWIGQRRVATIISEGVVCRREGAVRRREGGDRTAGY